MPVPARPVILKPNGGQSFSSNIHDHTLEGTASFDTQQILVNGSSSGVQFNQTASTWSFLVASLPYGPNIFQIVARNSSGDSSPAVVVINVLDAEDLNTQVTSPSGIQVKRKEFSLLLSWVANPETQVIGYNVYYSLNPAGGAAGYVKLNPDLISVVARIERQYTDASDNVVEESGVRTDTIVQNYQDVKIYEFEMTTLPDGTDIPYGQNIFFVVTAVAFDNDIQEEVESAYSSEVFGSLLRLRPDVNELVPRTEQDIQNRLIEDIILDQPELDISPHSYTRDVILDPIPSEIRYLYVVLDFISRAQSWTTLEGFDDAEGDGLSDNVTISPQKQRLRDALGLNDAGVQLLIDEQFDKKASDTGTIRKPATRAAGFVTLYREVAPEQNRIVPAGRIVSTKAEAGIPAVQFELVRDAVMLASMPEIYWNQAERRYELTVPIRALVEGEQGNVPAGSITQNIGIAGFKVVNKLSTTFGQPRETNNDLRIRAQLDLVGLDTGSKNGILKVALAQNNVLRAAVIPSNDPQMYRDWDDLRKMHVGGKTDVYLVGGVFEQVSDTFAFWYPTVYNEKVIIENVMSLRFRVTNSLVGPNAPIFEVLQVLNVTRGLPYVLTGYDVDTDGNVVQLNALDAGNIAVGLSPFDKVVITYRYKPSITHKFSRQPLREVVSVTGNVSGSLDGNYDIHKTEDPMLIGNSVYSSDSIRFFPTNSVKDESHVLNGIVPVALTFAGTIVGSIQVWNNTKTVLYVEATDFDVIYGNISTQTTIVRRAGTSIPDGSTAKVSYSTKLPVLPLNQKEIVSNETVTLDGTNAKDLLKYGVLQGTIVVKNQVDGNAYVAGRDYVITYGDQETKTYIRRSGSSSFIQDGEQVLVDYEAGENVTVLYVVNDLIRQVEEKLSGVGNGSSHATNNLVTKEAFEVLVAIVANVQVRGDLNLDRTEVKRLAATQVSKQFSAKLLGQGAGQSDIIAAIDNSRGIDRVRVPLAKMVRADGSIVVRQPVYSVWAKNAHALVDSWISAEAISEQIALNGTNPTNLSYMDPQEGTFIVKNLAELVTYQENIDYIVIYQGRDGISQIYRLAAGAITDGQVVKVQYQIGRALRFNTIDNGGAKVQIGVGEGFWYHPVAIVEDDHTPLETVFSEIDVAKGAGRAFIRSDRRIVVSPTASDLPSSHSYTVTYLVYRETGAKDLDATGLEYLRLGSISLNIVN